MSEPLVALLCVVGVILVVIGIVCFITTICQIYSNRKTINAILNHLDFNFPGDESMIVLDKRKEKKQ